MKSKTLLFKKLYIIFAFLLTSFFCLQSSIAGVSPPWAFSFDCGREYTLNQNAPDWNAFRKCENGVGPNLNQQTGGHYQEIIFAANNPLGLGAGSRQWIDTGKNHNSGGIAVRFSRRIPEFWLRWYHRWEYGFSWNWINGKKLLFFDMNDRTRGAWQPKILGFDSMGFRLYNENPGTVEVYGYGWDDLMANGPDDGRGHKASDGKWHYFEIHVKYESSIGASDGIVELWSDGKKVVSVNTVNFGNTEGALGFQAPSNQQEPGVNRPMYLDYDDFALRTTGYIGPIGGGDDGEAAESGDGGGGGCFIATAAFGSKLEKHVRILSEFRDKLLLTNSSGKKIVRYYYKVSPPIARYLEKHEGIRVIVRYILILVTAVAFLSLHINPLILLMVLILASSVLIYARKFSKQSHRM